MNVPRVGMCVLAAVNAALAVGFFLQASWATALWPWTSQPLDYVVISSFLAAGAGAVLWIGLTGEWGALTGALIDVGLFNATTAAWLWARWAAERDSAVLVRVVDPAAGKLQYCETKVSKGTFVTKTTDLFVRESGDWLFASVADETHDRYEWARIERDDDLLTVWAPDKNAFRALVQSGKLQGRLVDQGVILDPLSAEQMKALASGALGVPFKWDKPAIIHRLAR